MDLDFAHCIESYLEVSEFEERFMYIHRLIYDWDSFIQSIEIKGTSISESAKIHPSAVIGEDVYIGSNVHIGPHCYIRSKAIILNDCYIGFGVEIDKAFLCAGTKIYHNACVGKSFIGRRSNIAYGNVFSTKSLKGANKVYKNSSDFEVSLTKHHGSVVGANVSTGVNVSFMPGSTVYPHSIIMPNTSVHKVILK